MDVTKGRTRCNSKVHSGEESMDLRRGPWMVEEDLALINYIANYGEGRWNSLARSAGLKRTGKSCRLRWLNYLRPDVRRGNITLEEQLLILELHCRWGNRWSKIAQYLPGRTDNEIKNYWRTRVQKHAKQLKCDVNSKQFKDTVQYLWMPRLVERIQAATDKSSIATARASPCGSSLAATASTISTTHIDKYNNNAHKTYKCNREQPVSPIILCINNNGAANAVQSCTPENISTVTSSDSSGTQSSLVLDLADQYVVSGFQNPNQGYIKVGYQDSSLLSPSGNFFNYGSEGIEAMDQTGQIWLDSGDLSDNLWNTENVGSSLDQLNSNIFRRYWE